MLQIKNTLGGGKPEGLYAWKKNSLDLVENEYESNSTILAYEVNRNSNYKFPMVALGNYIYALGGYYSYQRKGRYDGTSWTFDTSNTLPVPALNSSAVVLNNQIHLLGGSQNSSLQAHYKIGTDGNNTSISTLPYDFYKGCAVVLDNEIHILGSGNSSYATNHYKWDGNEWTSVSTLPYSFYYGGAVVFNNEIHILGGSSNETKHYKWNGSEWVSVSTLPINYSYAQSCCVWQNKIFVFYGTNVYSYDGTSWKNTTISHSISCACPVVYKDGNVYAISTNSTCVSVTNIYEHNFVDYIVSDKENAYPDGGEKGGYWYERVKGIEEFLTCGYYSKVAIDEYIPASDSASITVSHSLGVKPEGVICLLNDTVEDGTCVSVMASFGYNDYSLYQPFSFYYGSKLQGSYNYAQTRNSSSITLQANNTGMFKAGKKYKVVTVA